MTREKIKIGLDNIPGYAALIQVKRDDICLIEAGENYKKFFTLAINYEGQSVLNGLSAIEQSTLYASISKKAQERKEFSYSRRAPRKEEATCWIHVCASYYKELDGFPAFIAVAEDVTDSVLTKIQLEDAANALEKANRELDSIFNAVIDGVAKVADKEGYPVIFANESFYRMIGYTKKQFAEECQSQLNSLSMPNAKICLEQAKTLRWQYRKKDGECCWNRLDIARTNETYEGVEVVYLIFTDINLIVKKEKELDRQIYYQSLIDKNSPCGTLIRSAVDLTPLYLTSNIMRNFGYTQEEVYKYADGRKQLIVHPDDYKEVITPVSEYRKGHDYNKEFRVKNKDGNYVWYYEMTRLDKGLDEGPVYISSFMNITDLKKSQEEVHIREDEYRIMALNSGKMVYRYNCKNKTIDFPAETKYLADLVKEKNIPKSLIAAGLISSENEAEFTKFCNDIRAGEASGSIRIKSQENSDKIKWYESGFVTVYDEEKNPASVIITVEDITDEIEKGAVPLAAKREQAEVTNDGTHLILREKIPKVYIRTFGYFDVFIDGKILEFTSKKGKEFLALLVDRNGGFCTTEEAISILWENEPMDKVMAGRFRQTFLRLNKTLKEAGIEDIIISKRSGKCVNKSRFDCDLYQFLYGDDKYKNLFHHHYMTNYSWGENTLAILAAIKGE